MRHMSRGVLALIAALVVTLVPPSPSEASLIGDTVNAILGFDDGSGFVQQRLVPVGPVVEGPADEIDIFDLPSFPHLLDVDANEFTLLIASTGWADLLFNGWVIDDLDWQDQPGVITGVTFETNISGFGAERLTFTDNSVSINYAGLSVNNGFVRVVLEAPEPSPVVLHYSALVAVAALAVGRRKRLTRQSRSASTPSGFGRGVVGSRPGASVRRCPASWGPSKPNPGSQKRGLAVPPPEPVQTRRDRHADRHRSARPSQPARAARCRRGPVHQPAGEPLSRLTRESRDSVSTRPGHSG